MGLDITAYSNLVKVQRELSETDQESGLFIRICAHRAWPGREAGLEPDAFYIGRDELKFSAGSYGGYGEWRRWLARLAGYGSPQDLWEGRVTSGPFFELINFSDCEGTIGPVVAKKLAADFAEFDDRAKAAGPEWEYDRYKRWRTAFEMASDSGAVDFH